MKNQLLILIALLSVSITTNSCVEEYFTSEVYWKIDNCSKSSIVISAYERIDTLYGKYTYVLSDQNKTMLLNKHIYGDIDTNSFQVPYSAYNKFEIVDSLGNILFVEKFGDGTNVFFNYSNWVIEKDTKYSKDTYPFIFDYTFTMGATCGSSKS